MPTTSGFLARIVSLGTACGLSADEMELIAERKAAIIYNPTANMILGSGVCPLGALVEQGVTLAIGTDGMASNDNQNMIEVLEAWRASSKSSFAKPGSGGRSSASEDGHDWRSQGPWLGDMTGSLEPGKRADIVRFDGESFGAAVVHDPYQQIVYGAGPESIADVWVDGRRLLADGAFTSTRSQVACAEGA